MYTGIRDLLCLPARKPSAAHRACQRPCVVRVPPLPSLPLAWCPWKQQQAPMECFLETSGPSASWTHLGQALHGDIWAKPSSWSYPRGFFSPAWGGVSSAPFGAPQLYRGQGFQQVPWGGTPHGTQPHTLGGGRGLCGSQCCAGRGKGAAQPPLPPSLPA